jgi:ABC-type polysaccharide/polyol phosphate export permease
LLPKIEFFKGFQYSYFDFVFIADVSMRLPSLLTQSSIQAIKFAKNNNILLFLANAPGSLSSYLLEFMVAKSAKEIVKILLLFVLASLVFDFKFESNFVYSLLLLQLLFFPFFISISFFSALLFLKFGRGENLLMKGFSVLAVLSGLYFPLSVFPPYVENVLVNLSPLEQLLNSSRLAFEGNGQVSIKLLLYFISGTLISFILYKKIQLYPKMSIYEFDYKL